MLPRLLRPLMVAIAILLGLTGCAYKVGSGITAGFLDEMEGEGRSSGVQGVGEQLVERALLAELGHQIGEGLASGATEITDDQRANLESTIDSVLFVAASRTGSGLRNEVSPALREMVRRDIVQALADGMRNDVGSSAEAVIDRVITQAVRSLKEGVADPDLHHAMADMLRDSIYYAMEEGRPGVASVSDTLEWTLQRSVLHPFEESIDSLSDNVAAKVDAAGKRTENTLRAVIIFLGVVLVGVGLMYTFTRRQLLRAQESEREVQHELESVGAALNLMDENTRTDILGKLETYREGTGVLTGTPTPQRHAQGPSRTSPYTRRRSAPRPGDDDS